MRLFVSLAVAALASIGGGAHAAETYHLLNITSIPMDASPSLASVCVEMDTAKKLMVNGKYGRKIWAISYPVSARMAAEMMPFSGYPVLVSGSCLEEFIATFKGFYPEHKLQVQDIPN